MPEYVLGEFRAAIARNATLLDTNVLVARFLPDDERHAEAWDFLEGDSDEHGRRPILLVPLCVICEAWGFVVGKAGNRDGGIEMLRWVMTPGAVTVIRDDDGLCNESEQLCGRYHIDYVDAMLALLADRLSSDACMGSPIPIATFDIRDFARLRRANTHQFKVHDVLSGSIW